MPSQLPVSETVPAPAPVTPTPPAHGVPFRVSERVRWEDVDLAGVVRYSAYARLYDVAEAELWRAVGTSIPDLIDRVGIWLPRKVLHLEYHAPARLDALLEIRLAVTAIGTSSLTLEGEMWSADGITHHASVRVVLVCVDVTFAKYALPVEVKDRLAPYRVARDG